MNSEVFARVVFESPLPALSREFEYLVPSTLQERVQVGQRVQVAFAGQTKVGFVVSLSPEKEFAGKLAEISSIVSEIPVLSSEIFALLKSISERQCCSIGEILGNAIPNRAVRVEKSFTYIRPERVVHSPGGRFAERVAPVADSITGQPRFISRIAELVAGYLQSGRSVIVCVPDFRDLSRVRSQLHEVVDAELISVVDSTGVTSERYRNFLEQLTSSKLVVVGTRNAIYSPVAADAAIVIWDDGDQSHQDQQSPYLTTREIALLRQSLSNAPLHFLSHSRSAEVQRLVNIGYLTEVPQDTWRPKVSLSEGSGLDARSFQVIKRALENGPVLVQVAAPGNARSLFCSDCRARSMCRNCHGPLWLNSKSQIVCRWCGQFNLDFSCLKCKGKKLRQGAAGATRWAEQLGKSFPGVPVREVTAEQSEHQIPNRPAIVVCTAGVEPIAIGGFSGVALLDCSSQLNVDSLRAPEDALRSWLNALAFMRNGGDAIAVGLTPEVSSALSLGEISETITEILREREQLGFPPAKRLLSATGSREVIDSFNTVLQQEHAITVLGVSQAQTSGPVSEFRLVATFSYASGPNVSKLVRSFVAGLGSKQVRTNSKSGRNIRPVTIKFDDPRVV